MLNFESIEKTRSFLIWYFNNLKNKKDWIKEQSQHFPIILNKKFTNHADSEIGLKTVKVLDAVYRSIKSERVEEV